MLKFRASHSMKARQAAEAQRKSLEEKLKMEWAWKPMAAVMNEKESDLVYWVPPLYTSNLLTSFSSPSSSISSSLNSSPCSSFRRSSSIRKASSSSVISAQGSPLKKRKLAQRRPKMSPQQSIQEDENEVPISRRRRGRSWNEDRIRGKEDAGTTDEDRESGIHEEFSSLDEDTPCHPCHDALSKANHLRHSLKALDKQKKTPRKKSKDRFKHIPTLLKVVDKLSRIYTLPMTPPPPMYGANKPLRRVQKDFRTSSTRKPRRPSVKVYRVPSNRSSLRKSSEDDQQPQPFYVISRSKTPFGSPHQRASLRSKASCSSERTHIGLPTLSEEELRKVHLEMILKILSDLYEEKISDQNLEISHLRSKIQLQEKVIKQTAHLVLDLKNQMRTLQARMDFNEELKKFYKKTSMEDEIESSFPYHPLEPLAEESSDIQKSNLSLSTLDGEEEKRRDTELIGQEDSRRSSSISVLREEMKRAIKEEDEEDDEDESDQNEDKDREILIKEREILTENNKSLNEEERNILEDNKEQERWNEEVERKDGADLEEEKDEVTINHKRLQRLEEREVEEYDISEKDEIIRVYIPNEITQEHIEKTHEELEEKSDTNQEEIQEENKPTYRSIFTIQIGEP